MSVNALFAVGTQDGFAVTGAGPAHAKTIHGIVFADLGGLAIGFLVGKGHVAGSRAEAVDAQQINVTVVIDVTYNAGRAFGQVGTAHAVAFAHMFALNNDGADIAALAITVFGQGLAQAGALVGVTDVRREALVIVGAAAAGGNLVDAGVAVGFTDANFAIVIIHAAFGYAAAQFVAADATGAAVKVRGAAFRIAGFATNTLFIGVAEFLIVAVVIVFAFRRKFIAMAAVALIPCRAIFVTGAGVHAESGFRVAYIVVAAVGVGAAFDINAFTKALILNQTPLAGGTVIVKAAGWVLANQAKANLTAHTGWRTFVRSIGFTGAQAGKGVAVARLYTVGINAAVCGHALGVDAGLSIKAAAAGGIQICAYIEITHLPQRAVFVDGAGNLIRINRGFAVFATACRRQHNRHAYDGYKGLYKAGSRAGIDLFLHGVHSMIVHN